MCHDGLTNGRKNEKRGLKRELVVNNMIIVKARRGNDGVGKRAEGSGFNTVWLKVSSLDISI